MTHSDKDTPGPTKAKAEVGVNFLTVINIIVTTLNKPGGINI